MMELRRTASDYAIDVEVDDFLAVTQWEYRNFSKTSLGDKLTKLPGVDRVEYNGHFGPAFYFQVLAAYDKPDLHTRITRTISQHIAKCVQAQAKRAA